MFQLTHNTSFWGRLLQSTTSTNSVKALKDKMVCWEIQDWYHENFHDEKSSDNIVTIVNQMHKLHYSVPDIQQPWAV